MFEFSDGFEDGDADGWAESASSGGTTGVVDNNGSMRAFADTSGGYRSLSRDFEYHGNQLLSFDMQVRANSGRRLTIGGGSTTHATGGAKISFLDSFNGVLGVPVFLVHRTDGVMPPAYAGAFQDETLNSFSAPMRDYAALAGLGVSSGIAKVSMEFFASSGGGGGGTGTSLARATVWFDNVNLAAVETDSDRDGVFDDEDTCPTTFDPAQTDTDLDGTGDACDSDDDNDTVLDSADNCPLVVNPGQSDTDADTMGNACDSDDDNDGMSDAYESGNGLNPLDEADASLDLDRDDLSNLEEYRIGSRANVPDSDGDGINDGDEVAAGRSPVVNEQAVITIINDILLGAE